MEDLDEIYKKRNKKINQLNLNNAVLLILDMQNYFTDKESHANIPAAEYILKDISHLLRECIKNDLMVILTRHLNNQKNAFNMKKWWGDLIREENTLSQIHESLKLESVSTIIKHQYDAFYQTNLEEILKRKGINQVIISGVMTHLCCDSTARSAFIRGFEVFLLIDGMATYNREYHNSTLINLSHGFCDFLKCDKLFNLLTKR